MGYVGFVPDSKIKREAEETKHLREFYMYWMQMHAKASEKPIDITATQEAAQALTDKARDLGKFYE